jgi:hypothetical protein
VQPVATAVHGPNAQQPPYLVTSPFAYQRELGEQVFISSGLRLENAGLLTVSVSEGEEPT